MVGNYSEKVRDYREPTTASDDKNIFVGGKTKPEDCVSISFWPQSREEIV